MGKEIAVFNANSVDPDQTPRSAESNLRLHCLSISPLLDTSHNGLSRKVKALIRLRRIAG